VAERADVIIDFRQYAGKTIYLGQPEDLELPRAPNLSGPFTPNSPPP
jgi:hypothetical protein